MKIAPPGSAPFKPRTMHTANKTLSYYNEGCGEAIWKVIQNWYAKGCPRTSWRVTDRVGEREGTLKARLYNSLRWLTECGSEEQRKIAAMLTFTRIDGEYVLTVRRHRKAADVIADAAVSNEAEPSPRHVETNKSRAEFAEVRNAIFDFITTSTYDGSTPDRPVLEITGVKIDDEAAEDIAALVEQAENFKCSVTRGLNGAVRIVQFSEQEMRARGTLNNNQP